MTARIRNEGDWPPILAWLDELAGGQIIVPFGVLPPITRMSDTGTLTVRTISGELEFAKVGEYVLWDAAQGFRVEGAVRDVRVAGAVMTYDVIKDAPAGTPVEPGEYFRPHES